MNKVIEVTPRTFRFVQCFDLLQHCGVDEKFVLSLNFYYKNGIKSKYTWNVFNDDLWQMQDYIVQKALTNHLRIKRRQIQIIVYNYRENANRIITTLVNEN